MRLICPECNALYDIPAQMIPAEGREVECSACGHIWTQRPDTAGPGGDPRMPETGPRDGARLAADARGRGAGRDEGRRGHDAPARGDGQAQGDAPQMRGLSGDLAAARETSAPASGHDPAPDPGTPPQLQRPLPDDVLSILREETAREISARRAARQAGTAPDGAASPVPPVAPPVAAQPVADEIAADDPSCSGDAAAWRDGGPGGAGAIGDVAADGAAPAADGARADDLAGQTAGAAPATDEAGMTGPARQALSGPQPPQAGGTDGAAASATDWPATTVTAPDDSEPRVLTRLPAGARADARPVPVVFRPPAPEARDRQPSPVSAPVSAAAEARAPHPAPVPPAGSPDIASHSPPPAASAAQPAATLPGPPRRRIATRLPDAEKLAATLQVSEDPRPPVPPAAAPDLSPETAIAPAAGRAYGAGLAAALGVAGLLLGAYVLGALWVRSGDAPAVVSQSLAAIDRLRDALAALTGRGGV
ncbi:MAG: zinc-ribbon domain-containing protein [Paracoccus sp. (in: a-proteobacteria)]|nr:zinc-ribbon domain-containing protein [Paracoccus sp. (in: a-proteobacteria)]